MKARLEDLEEFATRPSKIQKERVKPSEKFDEMQKRAYEELELKLWAARRLEDMMGREAEMPGGPCSMWPLAPVLSSWKMRVRAYQGCLGCSQSLWLRLLLDLQDLARLAQHIRRCYWWSPGIAPYRLMPLRLILEKLAPGCDAVVIPVVEYQS